MNKQLNGLTTPLFGLHAADDEVLPLHGTSAADWELCTRKGC